MEVYSLFSNLIHWVTAKECCTRADLYQTNQPILWVWVARMFCAQEKNHPMLKRLQHILQRPKRPIMTFAFLSLPYQVIKAYMSNAHVEHVDVQICCYQKRAWPRWITGAQRCQVKKVPCGPVCLSCLYVLHVTLSSGVNLEYAPLYLCGWSLKAIVYFVCLFVCLSFNVWSCHVVTRWKCAMWSTVHRWVFLENGFISSGNTWMVTF